MRYIFIISLVLVFSCEAERDYNLYECKGCTTTVLYNGIEKDRTTGFYCGDELLKQEMANYTEVNNNQVIEIKTICTKSNTKQ